MKYIFGWKKNEPFFVFHLNTVEPKRSVHKEEKQKFDNSSKSATLWTENSANSSWNSFSIQTD